MVLDVDFRQRKVVAIDGVPIMEGRGTLLTFSIENWITVVIMAALGYMLFALISQFFQKGGASAIAAMVPGSMTVVRPGA